MMMLFVDLRDAQAHLSGCQIVGRRENWGNRGKPRHWRVPGLPGIVFPYAH